MIGRRVKRQIGPNACCDRDLFLRTPAEHFAILDNTAATTADLLGLLPQAGGMRVHGVDLGFACLHLRLLAPGVQALLRQRGDRRAPGGGASGMGNCRSRPRRRAGAPRLSLAATLKSRFGGGGGLSPRSPPAARATAARC